MNKKSDQIRTTKEYVFNRDMWRCQYPACFRPACEVAHRIGQTEANKKWIKDRILQYYNIEPSKAMIDMIIHHEKNLMSVCTDKSHNSYFDLGSHYEKTRLLLVEIVKDLIDKGLIHYG